MHITFDLIPLSNFELEIFCTGIFTITLFVPILIMWTGSLLECNTTFKKNEAISYVLIQNYLKIYWSVRKLGYKQCFTLLPLIKQKNIYFICILGISEKMHRNQDDFHIIRKRELEWERVKGILSTISFLFVF